MDKRLFFLMNMAQHRVYKFADTESGKRLGIPVTQVAAMLYVAKHEGCLQKDLSQALGLNNSAVTGLAGRMEGNELIERKPCELDGRATRLYLSEKGRDILPQIFPLSRELSDRMSEDFSEEEMEIVIRFLNQMLERF
ncbi:MAG: MarR family transcriptional regulator [Pseudomonadota bacterium]|nr:MarR family transcriptional regulator [Pseudomonadota bacterium]